LFLGLFLLFILFEGLLAYLIYRQTGEIDTFQVVIIIFIIYACTFGVGDFKKLDRYIKVKVGKWRKVDLLTEKDKAVMAKLKTLVPLPVKIVCGHMFILQFLSWQILFFGS